MAGGINDDRHKEPPLMDLYIFINQLTIWKNSLELNEVFGSLLHFCRPH